MQHQANKHAFHLSLFQRLEHHISQCGGRCDDLYAVLGLARSRLYGGTRIMASSAYIRHDMKMDALLRMRQVEFLVTMEIGRAHV